MDALLFDGTRATTESAPRPLRREQGLRSARAVSAGLLFVLLVLSGQPVLAQSEEEEEEEPLLRVRRIEMSLHGGMMGGETYLSLPAPLTELTNDTARDDILDFSGEVPDPPVQAPEKEIETGYVVGGRVTFFLNENFGMQLFGEFGQADAVFRGRRVIETEIVDEVTEVDRATMTTFAGGGKVVYHLGRERRNPRRPFVQLGFGGILNQFSDTDDVGALFFTAGGGYGFPITGALRGFVSADMRLYTWETDEVSLDSTLLFPSVTAGLTWRYDVPEEVFEDADEATAGR